VSTHADRSRGARRSESGQIVVWATFLLPILLVAAGLTFDVGSMVNIRAELEQAVDAAALAAAKGIADPSASDTRVRTCARDVAAKNNLPSLGKKGKKGSWVELDLNAKKNAAGGDIVLGNYDFTTRAFTRATTLPIDVSTINAVQINARLGAVAGKLPLEFGGLLGTARFDTTRRAIGVIAAPLSAKPTAPIAVDKDIFSGKTRGFKPPNDIVVSTRDPANAQWTAYFDGVNANTVKNLVQNPDQIPEVTVGVDSINLANGSMVTDYQAMQNRWSPGDEIIIPVVNMDVGLLKGAVVGFAVMKINAIVASGNPKYIAGALVSKKIIGSSPTTISECFGFNCRAFLVQ